MGYHLAKDKEKAPLQFVLECCYYCGNGIKHYSNWVYWHGSMPLGNKCENGFIFLHSECAKEFACHLAKDGVLTSYGNPDDIDKN